jgi:hypothetical protein
LEELVDEGAAGEEGIGRCAEHLDDTSQLRREEWRGSVVRGSEGRREGE